MRTRLQLANPVLPGNWLLKWCLCSVYPTFSIYMYFTVTLNNASDYIGWTNGIMGQRTIGLTH